MEELELIKDIASKKSLRIEQWRDDWRHWRAGIEWYGESQYEFICEYPTLLECLDKIKEFMMSNNSPSPSKEE